MEHLDNVKDTERNNSIICIVQTFNVIFIILLIIFEYYTSNINCIFAVIVFIIGLLPLIFEYRILKRKAHSVNIEKIMAVTVLIFYTLVMVITNNSLMFATCIPLMVISLLFSNMRISVCFTAIVVIINILISIIGQITNSCGYINSFTSFMQILTMFTMFISLYIINIVIRKNTNEKINALISTNKHIEYTLTHDYNTKLYNRYYLMNNVSSIFDTSELPIAVSLINIDGVKLINDFYGNRVGDKVISKVGVIIKRRVADRYVAIRMDSDEYMIVMCSTTNDAAKEVMEDIRKVVGLTKVDNISISIEYGITVIDSTDITLDSCITVLKNTLYQKKMLNKNSVRSSIIESLKMSLSSSDYETEQHAERTKDMAIKLANKLNLSDIEKSQLSLLAILHDIGKVSIPSEILKKPGKLNKAEWEIMKTHTTKGYDIAISTVELKSISKFILHHHEKWDGTGYTSGLAKEKIPLLSRIITIIDSHDVMTHDRPYHKAISELDAELELLKCSGTQFDPDLITVFIDMLHEEHYSK